MKKFMKKATSLALCGLMLLSMVLLPVAAGEGETAEATSLHNMSGYELLKAYGFCCTTEDNLDGTNPSITDARVVSLDNQNAILKVSFLKDDSNKYPGIVIKDLPTDLTNYTVKADLVTVIDDGNKLSYITYGMFNYKSGSSTKKATGNFGIRTANGQVECQNVLAPTGDKPTIGTTEALKELALPTNGVSHTVEATVVFENGVLNVTLKLDGILMENLKMADSAVLTESQVSLRAWHGFAYGFDNISVVNNVTGEVVFSEDFEDHSLSSEKTAVDDQSHGYVCVCGAAKTESHTFVEQGEVDDPNSCTTKKAKLLKCSGCGHELQQSNPHTAGEPVVKETTCLENGLRTVHCTACNEELVHEVLETRGHDFGLWEKTEYGKKRTCDICGEIEEINNTTKPAETQPEAAPETSAPDGNEGGAQQEKGCGSSVALTAVLFTVAGALTLTVRKKKEN